MRTHHGLLLLHNSYLSQRLNGKACTTFFLRIVIFDADFRIWLPVWFPYGVLELGTGVWCSHSFKISEIFPGDLLQCPLPEAAFFLLASSSRSLASNSLLGGYLGKLDGLQGRGSNLKNSLCSAEAADPRLSGSIARRTSKMVNTDEGKSLKVSERQRLVRIFPILVQR